MNPLNHNEKLINDSGTVKKRDITGTIFTIVCLIVIIALIIWGIMLFVDAFYI